MCEQLALTLETPAIAAEAAISAQDAVTGHHKGNAVGGASAADGSNGLRVADLLSYLLYDKTSPGGIGCRNLQTFD